MQDDTRKRRGPDPVVCAECRRLKLKCDRRLPCSTCFRRGCGAICPEGTLGSEPSRTATSGTQYLQYKVEAMARRIVELEDALAELQAQLSDKPHPLLAAALSSKASLSSHEENAAEGSTDSLTYSLGTLTLGEREHFFGPHCAVADYLIDSDENAPETTESRSSLPLDILILSGGFPMTSIREARTHMTIKIAHRLPPAPEARHLVDIYYRHATWLHMPIPQDELEKTVLGPLYHGAGPCASRITTHELGMFFLVLAIACAVDPDRPNQNPEAASYYELGRAALSIESVIDNPSIHCIRAVSMMSTFLQLYQHPDGSTIGYGLVGLLARFALSLGLHRDDTPWNLPESEQQRRRHLFWEIAVQDYWSGFASGRPPSLSPARIDAKHPEDHERFLGADGTWQASFHHWCQTFTHEVMFKIQDQAFGVKPPAYEVVLRLDRLVREHPISDGLRMVNIEASQAGAPETLVLQRYLAFLLTQRVLLFLHRSFFARALADCALGGGDPLASRHAQSVLAAFRCALYITAGVRGLHAQPGAPRALRFGVFWVPVLSAYFVLASIVIKAPASGLAPPAWAELNKVLDWLERLAPSLRCAARILPDARVLRTKAQEAYAAFTAGAEEAPRPVDTEFVELEKRFGWCCSRVVKNASKAPSPKCCMPPPPPPQDPTAEAYPWSLPDQLPPAPQAGQPFVEHQQQPQRYASYPWDPHPTPTFQQGFDHDMPQPATGSASFTVTGDWTQQMPQVPAASGLDIPWQLLMSGIGVDGQQDGGNANTNTNASNRYAP